MGGGGLASKPIGVKTALIIIVLLAIPAFFWFRFLYNQFVVDKVSPEMAKMRDGMLHAKPPTGVKGASATQDTHVREKGEKQH